MRYYLTPLAGTTLMLGLGFALAGCARAPSEAPAAAPPPVTVSYPVAREVTDYAEFTARTAAVDFVELRARVSGYLEKALFKEGALVKKGDVLFQIDPRTYAAEAKAARGTVGSTEASLALAEANLDRAHRLGVGQAIARQEFDTYAAQKQQFTAQIITNKAALERAELNLEFCTVRAPIDGRVSRYNVTVGNLVQAGDLSGGTLLTTIVSVDPTYAYFDVDERTVLRVKRLIREGKSDLPDNGKYPVWLGLANEDGFPHRGTIDFVDNQINPRTGTLKVRGVFPNKDEAISPGNFARVRVPIGVPHNALLITERALDTDQGQKVIYVVDKENRVTARPVRLGELHDGLREIIGGLTPGERLIINGLQRVRPGMTVEANLVDMPTKK